MGSDISSWFDRGVEQKKDFMVIEYDDWDDFPIYYDLEDLTLFRDKIRQFSGVMEVYDLRKDKLTQLKQFRCFSYPDLEEIKSANKPISKKPISKKPKIQEVRRSERISNKSRVNYNKF